MSDQKSKNLKEYGVRHLKPGNLSPLQREMQKQLQALKTVNSSDYVYDARSVELLKEFGLAAPELKE